MTRLEEIDTDLAAALRNMPCPEFSSQPWVEGPALSQRRIAIVSTAGLHRSDDRPFSIPSAAAPGMPADYRVIPSQCTANDLVMSHVSTNYDRTGFQQDWNVVFPLDRLRELAEEGVIGNLADFHYSFMGAADPKDLEPAARRLAPLLKQDQVDGVLLVPV